MATETTERVHLTVADARALSERAMRGIGYEPEEARILADHVIDAALCGYEYSGLPKLLNVADSPRFKALRQPMRVLKETSVSLLFDGGNQNGMLGMYDATRAVIERANAHGFALVGVNNLWMSGRSAYYVEMAARAGLIGIHTVAAPPMVAMEATPRQGGLDEIRIPGERAYRERARLSREGIEIDRRIHDALIKLAEGRQ